MKGYIIVNMTHEIYDNGHGRIPDKDRSSYIHYNLEAAETELLRLKQIKPYDDFVLFESILTSKVFEGVAFIENVEE